MRPRPVLLGTCVIAAALVARVAAAHISMTSPTPRSGSLKVGPCGALGSTRSTDPAKIAVFEPGATITVEWDETVNHPSHYRIGFDLDGSDFPVPDGFMDFSHTDNVLLDDIADRSGGHYTQAVTLPDAPCETCTLQLTQMMYDKSPYGDGNDIYYQCADVALRAGGIPGVDAGPRPDAADAADAAGADAGGGGGGCNTADSSAGSLGAVAFGLAIVAVVRRRRRPLAA